MSTIQQKNWKTETKWHKEDLHNAGCIKQVAGHVLWPRAGWLYQEAVTHRRVTGQVDCKLLICEKYCSCRKNMPHD